MSIRNVALQSADKWRCRRGIFRKAGGTLLSKLFIDLFARNIRESDGDSPEWRTPVEIYLSLNDDKALLNTLDVKQYLEEGPPPFAAYAHYETGTRVHSLRIFLLAGPFGQSAPRRWAPLSRCNLNSRQTTTIVSDCEWYGLSRNTRRNFSDERVTRV